MFIDKVKIYVKAGNGGNGCVSFHREKYVSHGGPDGGDGGKGGNIVLRIHEGTNTLFAYKNKKKFIAANGGDGKTGKMHGATADDLVLPVPPGTVVRDAQSGAIIKDMSDCEDFILCKGGRGGWGNRHFATPTRQIPRFAKNGSKGEALSLLLELKMIADVGLIGFPSVGKSSILSRISSAKPKIAAYHFTTLSPNLGVVSLGEGRGFVAADIPGLIEGAAEGLGLGHEFLRHVDRCRLLLHVVDISCEEGRDPIDDIEKINTELLKYSPTLAERPQLIVANKIDEVLIEEEPYVKEFEAYVKEHFGTEPIYVSAVTGEGMDTLIRRTEACLQDLPPITVYDSEYEREESATLGAGERKTEIRREGDTFYVEGEWIYNLMGQINFSDYESMNFFQRVLQKQGVFDLLKEAGIADGQTVNLYDFEFEFVY